MVRERIGQTEDAGQFCAEQRRTEKPYLGKVSWTGHRTRMTWGIVAPGQITDQLDDIVAEVLGAEIHFFDQQDYLLSPSSSIVERLVDIYRDAQPRFILTHPQADPANWDHVTACRLALEARMVAQAPGRKGGKIIAAPQVYCFEPHQTELCQYRPDTLLDISEVWELKWRAMLCIKSQTKMWPYYKNVAEQRGNTARRRTERKITHAEAYQRIFPRTVEEL